tara:strand:- start:916 stop:1239 length:324 start_codon:yes stop_codon:yes gene_type:complete
MIDTEKYDGHSEGWKRSNVLGFKSESVFDKSGRQIASVKLAGYDTKRVNGTYANLLLIADAPKLLAEVKRLQEENKVLAKYMNIVNKYDDALLADGDEDPRWSELYD